MHQETVGTINTMVVSDLSKAESCCKLIRSLPSNTGLEGHGIGIPCIEQCDVTAKINEQRELVSNGTTHITNVWLEEEQVGRIRDGGSKSFRFVLVETVIHAKSQLPLVVDCVTNFGSNVKSHVVLFHLST